MTRETLTLEQLRRDLELYADDLRHVLGEGWEAAQERRIDARVWETLARDSAYQNAQNAEAAADAETRVSEKCEAIEIRRTLARLVARQGPRSD